MLLQIKPESDTPIYLQLRDSIAHCVAAGELNVGDSLPSARELARDLGVNYHTVGKAYALLQAEGYVNVYGRRGAVIASPPEGYAAFRKSLELRLAEIIEDAKMKGMTPSEVARIAEVLARREEGNE